LHHLQKECVCTFLPLCEHTVLVKDTKDSFNLTPRGQKCKGELYTDIISFSKDTFLAIILLCFVGTEGKMVLTAVGLVGGATQKQGDSYSACPIDL